jgi:hypothetical protein
LTDSKLVENRKNGGVSVKIADKSVTFTENPPPGLKRNFSQVKNIEKIGVSILEDHEKKKWFCQTGKIHMNSQKN